jgi:hypothetical protein
MCVQSFELLKVKVPIIFSGTRVFRYGRYSQSQSAARILPSRNGHGTLLGDLSGYVTLVDSNNFDIKSAIPLVERAIQQRP